MHTLIVTFSLVDFDASAFERMSRDSAALIATVPGLIGKAYLIDETSNSYGGVYFFQNRSKAEDYVSSDIIASLASHPEVVNLTTAIYGTVEEATQITQLELALVAA
jgi:hypothetical protein